MDSTNKTLYIPLYGKAKMSEAGIIIKDAKAEEIWAREGFELTGKAKSKWLCYYMAMRGKVFDTSVTQVAEKMPDAVVLHIGRGMDSRCVRLNINNKWYDMDFAPVIAERRKYYAESENYKMLPADAAKPGEWLNNFEKNSRAIVVMEGVTMYLTPEEIKNLILSLQNQFSQVIFIADFYTVFGAKASKYKNPVKDVGAVIVSGMDRPEDLIFNPNINFVREWDMTPDSLINQLPAKDRQFFKKVMAGSFAKKIYRMFEYNITGV